MGWKRPLVLLVCAAFAISPPPCVGVAESVDALFTEADYISDYEAFWDTLETCYPYWGVLGRAGIDTEAVRTRGRERLEASIAANEGFSGFYRVIMQTCADLDYFAHLGPVDARQYYRVLESMTSYESPYIYQDWFDVLYGQKTADLYARLAEATEARASGGQPHTTVSSRLFPDERVGYIRFGSFDAFAVEQDAKEIATFLEKTKGYDHVIIDISRNPGGSTNYWLLNIVRPLGGAYSFDHHVFFTKEAAERLPILSPTQTLTPIAELPAGVIFEHPEDRAGLDFFSLSSWNVDFGEPEIQHNAKRWVLIGPRTYSAAEQFAVFCKETGWATLVGTATGGDGITTIMPSYAALPNTGLLVRFTAGYALNSDGTCNAESGTVPDIACEPWESPLLACLRLLEAEGVPTDKLKRDQSLRMPY